jgi:Putative auto-transporter adhesin, head GIN domain
MHSRPRIAIVTLEEVSAMNWFGIHSRVVAVVALVLGGVAVALLVQHDTTQKGPVEGSGALVTEYRSLPGFAGVEVRGTNNVVIHVGRPQTVAVTADDNLVSSVKTTVHTGTLVIDEPAKFTTQPLSVEVTLPSLTAVVAAGDGQVVVDGVKSPTLSVDLSGTGNVVGSGSVKRLTTTLSGTGNIDLSRLSSWGVFATLGGTGRIVVNAVHALHARVPGTGAIHYVGNPAVVDQQVSGTGAVAPT